MEPCTALAHVRPPTRPNGRYMRNASPSQIKIHALCERKWGFQYPFGMKPPRTKAFEFGRVLHKQLEGYTESGKYPTDRLARTALPLIPKYGTIGVMGEFKGRLTDSTPHTDVTIDLTDISELGKVKIIDYKTTADEEYIPAPEELMLDPQAVIYSYWALQRYNALVETTFIYMVKKGKPRAIPITIRPTPEYLHSMWEGYKARIEYMRHQYVVPRIEDFPGHPSAPYHPACQQYRGCPFSERCALIEGGGPRLFAAVVTANPKPVKPPMEQQPQNQDHLALFNQLHPADQQKILKGSSLTDPQQIASSPNLQSIINAMQQWRGLPTPEELEEKAAYHSYQLPMPALQLHPLERKRHWDMLPSGTVNPPDAAPNQTPQPPDPKDQPITDIDKIGETVGERMGEALGLGPVIPTVAQVAAQGLEFHKKVTGLSKNKMKEIIELAGPEAIEAEKDRQKKALAEVEATTPPAPEPGEMGEEQPTGFKNPKQEEKQESSPPLLSIDWEQVVFAEYATWADGQQIFYCRVEKKPDSDNVWELFSEILWFKIGMDKIFSEDVGRVFAERLGHLLSYKGGEAL